MKAGRKVTRTKQALSCTVAALQQLCVINAANRAFDSYFRPIQRSTCSKQQNGYKRKIPRTTISKYILHYAKIIRKCDCHTKTNQKLAKEFVYAHLRMPLREGSLRCSHVFFSAFKVPSSRNRSVSGIVR